MNEKISRQPKLIGLYRNIKANKILPALIIATLPLMVANIDIVLLLYEENVIFSSNPLQLYF